MAVSTPQLCQPWALSCPWGPGQRAVPSGEEGQGGAAFWPWLGQGDGQAALRQSRPWSTLSLPPRAARIPESPSDPSCLPGDPHLHREGVSQAWGHVPLWQE